MWQGTNLNKRDVTLDLTSDRGRDLVRRLVRDADVVVENFSPRVIEQFGLDYDSLVELKPDLIQVRMPTASRARGATTSAGRSTSSRHRARQLPRAMPMARRAPCRGPPIPSSGCTPASRCSPRSNIGAAQAKANSSKSHRSRSRCVAAEPLIEYSMNANVQPREGNRCRGHVQGVYPTAVDDAWVALCVRDDADWARIAEAMGRSDLLRDARFASAEQRRLAHDEFDAVVADWTRTQAAVEIINILGAHHLPAEQVLTPDSMYDIPQLDARGFYEEVEHPVTGPHRYPGWPFRMTPGPRRHHRFAPPTLGQHNEEILRGLGVTDDELEELRARRVIGATALNA
jgi:crotonobetainyl-CoA:carnitine CoA-transferase CaiB-like acyl-CoA transferase